MFHVVILNAVKELAIGGRRSNLNRLKQGKIIPRKEVESE